MERGYLIAALALIVTFTAMSHGARSLVRAAHACTRYHVWIVQPDGDAPQALRAQTMSTPMRVDVPDTSKLLAELNLPKIQQQAEMARQMAWQQRDMVQQQQDMARRMTEEMTRNSEEMSRNAEQMSRNMTERLVRQNMEIARCARARALEQVERALKNSQLVSCADCQ